MKVSQYDSYFEDIASRLARIAHTPERPRYAHYRIEEVLTGLRGNLDMTQFCLLQESIEGRIQAKSDEAVNNIQTGAIMVVRHVAHDDFADERTAIDTALIICEQVAARMIADKREAIHSTDPDTKGFRGLNVSGFSYQEAGTVFDNCFGYRLEFQYISTDHLIVDPDEWISEE
jgi:hypothetical protein